MCWCMSELYRQLTSVQAQVVELQLRRQVWQLYKEVGSVELQQKIQNLQSEIDSISKTFQEMSGELYLFWIVFYPHRTYKLLYTAAVNINQPPLQTRVIGEI